jgi:hypothetical protein
MSRNLFVRAVAAIASASVTFVLLLSVVSLAERPGHSQELAQAAAPVAR